MSLRTLLRRWLGVAEASLRKRPPGFFSTDIVPSRSEDRREHERFVGGVTGQSFQRTIADFKPVPPSGMAMDSAEGREWQTAMDDWNTPSLKETWAIQGAYGIPEVQIEWYASQGFIGYQMCAILSQQWLVDKACTMPAKDATRNGYEITVNDGTEVPPDLFDFIKKMDKRFHIRKEAREFVRNCRIFGIRIALFIIESDDPDYYLKPFNPDGITAGSYKGISQVDPYWITPELDMDAASNPASMHFYEPTFWRINGKRYHRSHLVIIKTTEVPDVLKPTYFYGGIPLTQRIYERVYAAERTANEAPQLALTKRTSTIHVDLAAAAANQQGLESKLAQWSSYRDNYATRVLGLEEESEETDTSLSDFDESGHVAICVGVRHRGCADYEDDGQSTARLQRDRRIRGRVVSRRTRKGIQEHDVRPLVERHHICVMRSYVMPKYNLAEPIELQIEFNELDAETAGEKAKRTLDESTRDKNWADAGALDGIDIRNRIISDADSGYNGMSEAIPEGPRPISVVDPGAEKTAPNAPTPAEQVAPGGGAAPSEGTP